MAQRGDALAEAAAPHTVSAADVAGAALALDIIANLLAIGPKSRPDLISLSRGGLLRRRVALDFSGCTHCASRGTGVVGV
jgi:hypothetical protein